MRSWRAESKPWVSRREVREEPEGSVERERGRRESKRDWTTPRSSGRERQALPNRSRSARRAGGISWS